MVFGKYDVILSVLPDSPYYPLLKTSLASSIITTVGKAELLHLACDDVKIDHHYFCEMLVVNAKNPQEKQRVRIPNSYVFLILDPLDSDKKAGFQK